MVSENKKTEKKRVSISLTEEQYALVSNVAKERGFSMSAIFVLALEEYAEKYEVKK